MSYTENLFLNSNILTINDEQFNFIKEIGQGKSATSYLYQNERKKITLKKYRKTEQNKIPFDEALDFEIISYERLIESEVPTPQLIGFNRESYIMVKEYIDGPVMINYVAENKVGDAIYQLMFEIQNKLKNNGYHIDYYPANFVFSDDKIFYIDYETHIYNAEWDFINWGIFYWLNTEGIKQFLVKEDHNLINKPNSYKPHEEGFIEKRNLLVKQFNN